MIDWDEHVVGPTVGVFGEPFDFELAGASPLSRDAVFDEAYLDLNPADGQAVTTEMPIVGIRTSEFPQLPKQDDVCTCRRTGEKFVVKEVRVDGHGHAVLKLNLIALPCC